MYVFLLVIFLLVDFVWIYFVILPVYTQELGLALRSTVLIIPSLFTYLLIVFGIYYFVKPSVYRHKKKEAIVSGVIVGLLMYGVYTLTNYAILASWSLLLVVTDILWGMFIGGFVSWIFYFVVHRRR